MSGERGGTRGENRPPPDSRSRIARAESDRRRPAREGPRNVARSRRGPRGRLGRRGLWRAAGPGERRRGRRAPGGGAGAHGRLQPARRRGSAVVGVARRGVGQRAGDHHVGRGTGPGDAARLHGDLFRGSAHRAVRDRGGGCHRGLRRGARTGILDGTGRGRAVPRPRSPSTTCETGSSSGSGTIRSCREMVPAWT